MELEEYLDTFFEEISPGGGIGTPYRDALIPMVCGYALGLSTDQLRKFMGIRAYLGSATVVLKTGRKPEICEMDQLLKLHDQGVHFKTAAITVFPESDIQEQFMDELRKYA